jgi:cytochrome c-type biogenesis protein
LRVAPAAAAALVEGSCDVFGLDIFDIALAPAAGVALLAGVLSFLSPCVLPIVPPYIAYMGGVSLQDVADGDRTQARKAMLPAVFFVMGLSTVFLLLGFTASTMGHIFLANQDLFATIAGVVVIGFAIHFLGIVRIPILMREARIDAGDRGGSAFGAYVLGLAFAFGWTPCIGPVLGAILTMAASEASVARGTMLLGIYAIGLGLPFLIVAATLQRSLGLLRQMRRHMGVIEKAMGVLLLLVGIALVTGAFSAFSWWLLETFPGMALLG